jgi:A/G-specific adenine glycosylase
MNGSARGQGKGNDLSADLLEWYDAHARVLPWRVAPADRAAGVVPDPYRVWLSEVMLQQTTVAAVQGYFRRFTALWPTVGALAAAPDAQVMGEWAGLGYYARARNLLACARAVVDLHGGVFPSDHAALRALPGIGPYTAAAVASIAYDQPQVVVDGNVERVMARLFAVTDPLPGAKGQLVALAGRLTPLRRPGDHAQAVMDLGATICTPRKPACGICPWMGPCAARAQGIAASLPAKAPKKAVPQRGGEVFVGRRADGAWLVETRPPRGLLGGMLGWPGSDWAGAGLPEQGPPCPGDWQALGAVRHTFTHFHLTLQVMVASLPQDIVPQRGVFLADASFDATALPTLMRKVHALAAPTLPKVPLRQD